MPWRYSQSSGKLTSPDGLPMAAGYSGAQGWAQNNPAAQNLENVGPIPQGLYSIDEPITTTAHGPYALPLIPAADNQMFGRSQFLMHGDAIGRPGTASQGCVIMPLFARERVWQSDDHVLEVVV